MRSAFHKRAVFSDETENYRTPTEPEPGDTVNIRIRTKEKNVDANLSGIREKNSR